MLPDSLEWILEMLGFNWPTADEDKLIECANAWRQFASEVEGHESTGARIAGNVLAQNAGDSIEGFSKTWEKFSGGSGYFDDAKQAAEAIAFTFEAAAALVIGMKIAVIVQLAILAAEIIAAQVAAPFTLGLSEIGGAAATLATREVVRRLIKEAAKQLLDAVLEVIKEPFVSALEAIASDLIAQTVNQNFGAQNGYSLGRTAKAGAEAFGDAVKNSGETLGESLRDGAGHRAGHRARGGLDSAAGRDHEDGDSGSDSDSTTNSDSGSDTSNSRDNSSSGRGDNDSGGTSETNSGSNSNSGSDGSGNTSTDSGNNNSSAGSGDRSGSDNGGPATHTPRASDNAGTTGSSPNTPNQPDAPESTHNRPPAQPLPPQDQRSPFDEGYRGSDHNPYGASGSPDGSPTPDPAPNPDSGPPHDSGATPDSNSTPESGPTPDPARPDSDPTGTQPTPDNTSDANRPDTDRISTQPAHDNTPDAARPDADGTSTHPTRDNTPDTARPDADPISTQPARDNTPDSARPDSDPISTQPAHDNTPDAARPAPTSPQPAPEHHSPTPDTPQSPPPSPTPDPVPQAPGNPPSHGDNPNASHDSPANTPANGDNSQTGGGRPAMPHVSTPPQGAPVHHTPSAGQPIQQRDPAPGDPIPTVDDSHNPTLSTESAGTATLPPRTQHTPDSAPNTPQQSQPASPTPGPMMGTPGIPPQGGPTTSTPRGATPTTSNPAQRPNRRPDGSQPNRDVTQRPTPDRPAYDPRRDGALPNRNRQGQQQTPRAERPARNQQIPRPNEQTPQRQQIAQQQRPGQAKAARPDQQRGRPENVRSNGPRNSPNFEYSGADPRTQSPASGERGQQPDQSGRRDQNPAQRPDPGHPEGQRQPEAGRSVPHQAQPPVVDRNSEPQAPRSDRAEGAESLGNIRNDLNHHPAGLLQPHPNDQQSLENAHPRNPDGTPQRFADPFDPWGQLQNDGGFGMPGRSNNCADCSRSFLETWYGNPQVSAPRTLDTNPDGTPARTGERDSFRNMERWAGARHANGGTDIPRAYDRVARDLLRAGHGSAAVVGVSWPKGGGHVFNAVNHHGKIIWVDSQSGVVSETPINLNAKQVVYIPLDADRQPIHKNRALPKPADARVDQRDSSPLPSQREATPGNPGADASRYLADTLRHENPLRYGSLTPETPSTRPPSQAPHHQSPAADPTSNQPTHTPEADAAGPAADHVTNENTDQNTSGADHRDEGDATQRPDQDTPAQHPDHHPSTAQHEAPTPASDTRPYDVDPGGVLRPDPADQQALDNSLPRNPDGTPQRHPDPNDGDWLNNVNGRNHNDPGRANNCPDAALSLVDTYSGRPTVAAPRTPDLNPDGTPSDRGETNGRDRMENTLGTRFRDYGDGHDAYTRLENTLRNEGHGSQAVIITTDSAGRSHAWNVINHNGNITYADPQTGARSNKPLYNGDHGVHAIPLSPDRRPADAERRPSASGKSTHNQSDHGTSTKRPAHEPSATQRRAPEEPAGAPGDTPEQRTTIPERRSQAEAILGPTASEVVDLDNWLEFHKDKTNEQFEQDVLHEMREAKRLIEAYPNHVIHAALETDAPLGPDGNHLSEFDLGVAPRGKPISLRVEVTSLAKLLKTKGDVTEAIKHGAEKMGKRERAGAPIPRPCELSIYLKLHVYRKTKKGNTTEVLPDGTKNMTMKDGNHTPHSPTNIFDEIKENLTAIKDTDKLDRITFVDPDTGVIAELVRTESGWTRA
ncbi:toxin glutamine deamidase domain-containing protein [Streptomyces sp. NPDC048483]|uniref:toxin glutamine deamidase domain-containing protein n=1 Tax=Streptomyces sp. NPDC048483 TaxID=3154927 RepID=UPI003424ABB8